MTQEQKQNLITLANGLLGNINRSTLAPSGLKFDMGVFADSDEDQIHGTCGTAGCAIGWAPYFGIQKIRYEGWMTYSERFTGLSTMGTEWAWCFSSDWVSVDNTRIGAAQRIIYYLQYGIPDEYKVKGYFSRSNVKMYKHIKGFCEYWLKENMQ